MRKIKLFVVTVFIMCCSMLCMADNKPSGLMTDLIEHTDYTWQNGYVSNVPVWRMEGAIENLQFVEIRSSFPSFSWIVPGTANGTYQNSYRIIVADNIRDANGGNGNVWDSGTVEGRKSTSVLYSGNALQPSKNYFWRVKTVTSTAGESEWSNVKAFRTAEKLSDYTAGYYPQVKTLEHPSSIKNAEKSVVFIDFGKAAFAQLVLNLTSDNDKDSVVVHIGEHAKDGRVDRRPGGTIRYQRYTIGLMKGTHSYRIKINKDRRNTGGAAVLIPDYIGEVLPFRYCEIEGYEKTVKPTDVIRESVHYPFDDSASHFESNNDVLNQVWELCKYTIKPTSFLGIYVDGDRERIPYEADALINQLCHYGVDREYSMARRSIEYLYEYPTWPTEWILQALIMAWNDYMYTGDSRSLKANYDILKKRTLMALREKNGLISTKTGLQTPEFQASIRFTREPIRDIVDWPHTGILGLNQSEGGEADGFVFTNYNAVTNAYHYEALKIMSEIAKTLNNKDEAAYYENEAKSFLVRYNKMFFDNKKGFYVDGDTTNHSSLHANMFPVAFGMVPQAKMAKVLEFMRSRNMACSVYGSQFLMDALYNASDADYALEMLTKTDDRSWYNMIRAGSTISMEAWDNKFKPNQDWNHAWGAAPANVIPRKLMGVEPMTPGFDKVSIKPQISSLTSAKSIVPTIKGEITLAIENKKGEYTMELTIPANMDGETYLPLLSKKYEVKINGAVQKTTVVKNAPFISLGTLAPGKYSIVMKY